MTSVDWIIPRETIIYLLKKFKTCIFYYNTVSYQALQKEFSQFVFKLECYLNIFCCWIDINSLSSLTRKVLGLKLLYWVPGLSRWLLCFSCSILALNSYSGERLVLHLFMKGNISRASSVSHRMYKERLH